jgi:phosphoribosyl-AMP cyclohydrolase
MAEQEGVGRPSGSTHPVNPFGAKPKYSRKTRCDSTQHGEPKERSQDPPRRVPARVGGASERYGRIENVSDLDPDIAARLRRDPNGLVPAIVQEHGSNAVLMLAWMNDEALHRTLTTGRATYWSRSRQEYWVKGETSGHHQYVRSVALDCDGDAVLITVDQVGAACHTGAHSCFHTIIKKDER